MHLRGGPPGRNSLAPGLSLSAVFLTGSPSFLAVPSVVDDVSVVSDFAREGDSATLVSGVLGTKVEDLGEVGAGSAGFEGGGGETGGEVSALGASGGWGMAEEAGETGRPPPCCCCCCGCCFSLLRA